MHSAFVITESEMHSACLIAGSQMHPAFVNTAGCRFEELGATKSATRVVHVTRIVLRACVRAFNHKQFRFIHNKDAKSNRVRRKLQICTAVRNASALDVPAFPALQIGRTLFMTCFTPSSKLCLWALCGSLCALSDLHGSGQLSNVIEMPGVHQARNFAAIDGQLCHVVGLRRHP